MDPQWWLLSAGVAALVLLLVSLFLKATRSSQPSEQNNEGPARPVGGQGERVARPQARRNIRMRLAALHRARGQLYRVDEDEEGSSSSGEEPDGGVEEEMEKKLSGKIGTKKMKRIQEKAERRERREQELVHREDQKRREALQEADRKKQLKVEKKQREMEEDMEREKKLEEERKEQEEYLRLKEEFVVEEEGEDATEGDETKGIKEFIDHIKKEKVVTMEDLAAEFNLKTQDAIARLQSLKGSGELTGVIDDRGKFIYISTEEMQAVANFIKQKGRVSISELVSSSNTLINLKPAEHDLAQLA